MEAKVLSQTQADELLKSLQDRANFARTFQAEIDRKNSGETIWALPPEDINQIDARIYYLVITDNSEPYLLVAVNGYRNVSSVFASLSAGTSVWPLNASTIFPKRRSSPGAKKDRLSMQSRLQMMGFNFFKKLALTVRMG
jgi:hypothetical protein